MLSTVHEPSLERNLTYQKPLLGDGAKPTKKGALMRREEYLRNRRLQGINTNIGRTQHQIQRTQQRKEELKARFESHKKSHEQALSRIDNQVQSLENRIKSLEAQKQRL